jgi:hypothetical protein
VSWFCRAGLSAVVVACVFVLAPVTALARYPDDNGHHYGQLWNPGHHYGQLKHHQAPQPLPAPSPAPTPHHGSGGSANNLGHVANPGAGQSSGDQSSIPDLPITFPLPGDETPQVLLVGSTPDTAAFDWLLLAILPALAALWVMVFSRTADAARRRRKAAV